MATTLCWARSIVIGTIFYAHPKRQLKTTPKSLFVARRDDDDDDELRNEKTAKRAPPLRELYRTKSCVDSTTAKKTRTCVRTVHTTGKCSSVRIFARAAATENTVGLFGRSGGNEMVASRTQWPHFGTLHPHSQVSQNHCIREPTRENSRERMMESKYVGAFVGAMIKPC